MRPAAASHILLCSETTREDLHAILADAGFQTTRHHNGHEPPPLDVFNLVLIDGSDRADWALKILKRLRQKQGEAFVPILYIGGQAYQGTRLTSLEFGADSFLHRPFEPAELLAQIQAFLRIKERHDNLSSRAAEVNRVNQRLQQAYQQIDRELELARRIQESFLPHRLPEIPNLRLAVQYKTCERVGGDFYDLFRLDEQHLGFYVADAMGHGVPASLLTIFVKTGVKAKEIQNQSYRLIPPREVLYRLNRDLIDQGLSDQPFVTMVYGLFNFRTGLFDFSRAGHPYPLYIPREGPLQMWQVEGSLLGVFEIDFVQKQQQLNPGDKLLLYTDGVDAAGFENHPLGIPSLLAAVERLRHLSIEELVESLARDLFGQTQQTDDLTLLGLEYSNKSEPEASATGKE